MPAVRKPCRFRAKHQFLVCIDSDGCAFDTMGIKQRECFCPWMIQAFGLQPVAEAARACKEFADLFSETRGANRHVTLRRILSELLPAHPQVRSRGFSVPVLSAYFDWVSDPSSLLTNEGLRQAIKVATCPEVEAQFRAVLAWSERVNWAIAEIVRGIPPFPGVRDALEAIAGHADAIVVSATPVEALEREWEEHGIACWVELICGQEMGTKKAQIGVVSRAYAPGHVLMIGDAPGDRHAAEGNGAIFYPIVPGEEEASWKALVDEALDRFFGGTYRGRYEQGLMERFAEALPENPPWKER